MTPEALRLAEVAPYLEGGERGQWIVAAAAELRRLHEVNQELREALKDATEGLEIASAGGGVDFYAYAKTSRAAIAKAEGEMK